MNLEELHNRLQEEGIIEEDYYLHGLYGSLNDENKIALTILKKSTLIDYKIYFKEKGNVSILKIFNNEEAACIFILESFLAKKNKTIF